MKISELPQKIREKSLGYKKNEKETETPQDQNVLEVIESFKKRSEVGFKKYGTNTERTDIDLLGWLNHLQEELQDAIIYIQRIKKEI